MNWYLEALIKYATFKGRARRKEYWLFTLFNFLILFILLIFDSLIGAQGVLFILYFLATLLPNLAVTVRRLHDIGKSGWWILISIIPIIGGIVLVIFMCTDSQSGNSFDDTTGRNQYGGNPKLNKN